MGENEKDKQQRIRAAKNEGRLVRGLV